jgi:hypothetical protein
MRVLRDNTRPHADHTTYLECRGEELPDEPAKDIVVSIGVLHHIPDPVPVIAAAYKASSPAATCLFGSTDGRATPDSSFSRCAQSRPGCHIPSFQFSGHGLNALLGIYIAAARRVPVPFIHDRSHRSVFPSEALSHHLRSA